LIFQSTALASSDDVARSTMFSTVLALPCNRVVDISVVRPFAITHTKRVYGSDLWSWYQRISIGLILKQEETVFAQGALGLLKLNIYVALYATQYYRRAFDTSII
jgi:hypothetical protein